MRVPRREPRSRSQEMHGEDGVATSLRVWRHGRDYVYAVKLCSVTAAILI